MSKKNHIATAAFAGLLALTPAFAWQSQGTTSGSNTGSQGSTTGSGTTGSGTQGGSMGSGSTGSGSMGSGSQGTTGSGQAHQGVTQLSTEDRRFMMAAAEGGLMEVELGRLASQKASSTDVKSFGQRMVTDHGQANQRLMQIAAQKNVTLPTALPADKRKEMDKLSGLSGAEFDRMYMSHMLKHHKKDISDFEKASNNGRDSSVKSFAQTTLPTLREHMQIAQTIAPKVGAKDDSSDHAAHKSGS
jgi:putative membrane protein